MHGAVAHAGEDVEVEEVHRAQDEEDATEFDAEEFHGAGAIFGADAEFQG